LRQATHGRLPASRRARTPSASGATSPARAPGRRRTSPWPSTMHSSARRPSAIRTRPLHRNGPRALGRSSTEPLALDQTGGTADTAASSSRSRSRVTGRCSSSPTRGVSSCASTQSGERSFSRSPAKATSSRPRCSRSHRGGAWNASRPGSGSSCGRPRAG